MRCRNTEAPQHLQEELLYQVTEEDLDIAIMKRTIDYSCLTDLTSVRGAAELDRCC